MLFQLVVSLGLVRDGLKVPLDETCTNVNANVVVVREHVLRTFCGVCVTDARVAQPVPSRSCGLTGARHVGVSTCCFTGLD